MKFCPYETCWDSVRMKCVCGKSIIFHENRLILFQNTNVSHTSNLRPLKHRSFSFSLFLSLLSLFSPSSLSLSLSFSVFLSLSLSLSCSHAVSLSLSLSYPPPSSPPFSLSLSLEESIHGHAGYQRCNGCLIFIGRFHQKSPIINGSFAESTLQLKVSWHLCHPVPMW